MLIHSYLTNGEPMFRFALLFLDSFKYYHSEDIKIVFSTRGMRERDQRKLKKRYKNLDILNEKFHVKEFCKKTGYSKEHTKYLKEQLEKGKNISGKKDLIMMKQFVSVEDRYRNSILDVMNRYNNYEHMLHLDIDICFGSKLNPLFDIVKNNDLSIKFRDDVNYWRLIVGYVLGFTINDKTKDFMNTFRKYIDSIPLHEKPKGYGQACLYYTYKDFMNYMDIGSIPAWMTASSNNYYKKEKFPLLLSGNKGNKLENIEEFKEIYKR